MNNTNKNGKMIGKNMYKVTRGGQPWKSQSTNTQDILGALIRQLPEVVVEDLGRKSRNGRGSMKKLSYLVLSILNIS